MFCVKILGLLIVSMFLVPETYATFSKIQCHECDRMADHCAFRCSWMASYARFYYCDDHCKRRDLACRGSCIRRDGQKPVQVLLRKIQVPIGNKADGSSQPIREKQGYQG